MRRQHLIQVLEVELEHADEELYRSKEDFGLKVMLENGTAIRRRQSRSKVGYFA